MFQRSLLTSTPKPGYSLVPCRSLDYGLNILSKLVLVSIVYMFERILFMKILCCAEWTWSGTQTRLLQKGAVCCWSRIVGPMAPWQKECSHSSWKPLNTEYKKKMPQRKNWDKSALIQSTNWYRSAFYTHLNLCVMNNLPCLAKLGHFWIHVSFFVFFLCSMARQHSLTWWGFVSRFFKSIMGTWLLSIIKD